jgi:polysaccharide biosynthesis transport protein
MLERITAAIAPPGGAVEGADHELIGYLREQLEVLRRSWRLVAAAVLVALTAAVIYLARTPPLYRATARLLVLQQGGRPLNVAGNEPRNTVDGGDDYIPTHALIIASPTVVDAALQSLGTAAVPSLVERARRADKAPAELAIERLRVTRPDRTAKVLRVDYEAGSRQEAARTLAAVVASYRKFLDATFRKNSGQVIALITRARDDLSRELRQLEADYLKFRRESDVRAAYETGRSFMAARLEHSDRAVVDARSKALQLKLQLELGRKLAAEGAALWAVAHAIGQLGGDSAGLLANLNAAQASSGAHDYLRHLVAEQHQLAERYGAQNARAKELDAQIARVRERARDARLGLESGELRDLLLSIEQSYRTVQAMQDELERRYQDDQDQAKEVEIGLITESNLRAEVERQRNLFNTVVDQLKQAQFAGDFTSINSEVIEPVNALRRPVSPKVALVLAVALLAGAAAGVAAAVAADRLDQRVRSFAELRRILDYAVLGQVQQVRDDQQAAVGEFGLVVHALGRSPWAEAYRAVRTNLEFLRRDRRLGVVAVTSPHSGDGKSSTASNLAISLAQAGRRVLLIDADLRKPSQQRIHGLAKEPGLSNVLGGSAGLSRVVQRTAVANLDLVATGPEPPNPAELLTSPRLAALLEEARPLYDLVLVDSSPILAVTDPAILGAAADGVVLVVRPSRLKVHDAERVAEQLGSLGTPVLGMVLNGVGRERAGYGTYGTYGTYGGPAAPPRGGPAEPAGAAAAPGEGVPAPSANGHARDDDAP